MKNNELFYKKIFNKKYLDNTYNGSLQRYDKNDIFKWIELNNTKNFSISRFFNNHLFNKLSNTDSYFFNKDQIVNLDNIENGLNFAFNTKFDNLFIPILNSNKLLLYKNDPKKIYSYICWNDFYKFRKIKKGKEIEYLKNKFKYDTGTFNDYVKLKLDFNKHQVFLFDENINLSSISFPEDLFALWEIEYQQNYNWFFTELIYWNLKDDFTSNDDLGNKMEKHFNYNDNNSLVLEDLFFGDDTFQTIFDVADSFSGSASAILKIPRQPAFNQYNFLVLPNSELSNKNDDFYSENSHCYPIKIKSLLDNALIINDTYNELKIICDLAWNNDSIEIQKEMDDLFKIFIFGICFKSSPYFNKKWKINTLNLKYDRNIVFSKYKEYFNDSKGYESVPTLIPTNLDELINEKLDSMNENDLKDFNKQIEKRINEVLDFDNYFSLTSFKMLKVQDFIKKNENIENDKKWSSYDYAKLSLAKAINYYFYRKFRSVEHTKFENSAYGEENIINYYLSELEKIKSMWSSHHWSNDKDDEEDDSTNKANHALENNELNWSITRSVYILDFYSWKSRLLDFFTKKYLNTVNIPFYDRVYKNDPTKKINLNLSNLVNDPKKLEITIANQLKTNFDLISNNSFNMDEYVKIIMGIIELQMFSNQNYNRWFYYFIADNEVKDNELEFTFIENEANDNKNNDGYFYNSTRKISKLDYFIYLLSARLSLSKQLYWNLFFIVNYCSVYTLQTLKDIVDVINKPYIAGSKQTGYTRVSLYDQDGYYVKYDFWWENVLKMIKLHKFTLENSDLNKINNSDKENKED